MDPKQMTNHPKVKKSFPVEFSQFLTPLGRAVLRGGAAQFRSMFQANGTPFVMLNSMIDPRMASACTQLLDQRMHALLSPYSSRIPADSISSMKSNYTESLEKVFRFKTAFLSRRTARAYESAEALGILTMMRSESFATFAETVTGLRLVRPAGLQIICYEHGDYVGPHNDHHPEEDPSCRGYVDVHLTFSNDAVEHQFLVYERNRHLSQIVDCNLKGGISIYKLPFWHQVTPLVGKPGQEPQARRWLLLGTFDIQTGPKNGAHPRKRMEA
jgi:hypothetical protein